MAELIPSNQVVSWESSELYYPHHKEEVQLAREIDQTVSLPATETLLCRPLT